MRFGSVRRFNLKEVNRAVVVADRGSFPVAGASVVNVVRPFFEISDFYYSVFIPNESR